jgi:hypothetical protein
LATVFFLALIELVLAYRFLPERLPVALVTPSLLRSSKIVCLLLKDEVASGKISLHSLTVLPTFGSKTSKAKTAISGIKDSKSVPSETLSEPVVEKRTVSWAEIASRGIRGD